MSIEKDKKVRIKTSRQKNHHNYMNIKTSASQYFFLPEEEAIFTPGLSVAFFFGT
jgi:hypothetical protein